MTHDLKNLWERHGQAKPPSRHTLRQLAEVKIIDRYDERVLLLWLSRVASNNHCNNNNTIIEEKDMLVFFACRFVRSFKNTVCMFYRILKLVLVALALC
jgi:hypothetical protein